MKSFPRFYFKAALGSTLSDLLIALIVIVIFLGLLFPGHGIKENGRTTQAKNDETNIVSAIKSYYTEYGIYPIDTKKKTGVTTYSTDNNALFDVLRNVTGTATGNALNPRNIVFMEIPAARDQNKPIEGLDSTGVYYDPWGSPYNVAINPDNSGELNSTTKLNNFYSDMGTVHTGVIVWSFGKNGQLGGGPAIRPGFANESGHAGIYNLSGDVVSWQ